MKIVVQIYPSEMKQLHSVIKLKNSGIPIQRLVFKSKSTSNFLTLFTLIALTFYEPSLTNVHDNCFFSFLLYDAISQFPILKDKIMMR